MDDPVSCGKCQWRNGRRTQCACMEGVTDLASVPTVELLTRAADAAGKAAELAGNGRLGYSGYGTEVALDNIRPEMLRLIEASGPDHWRAAEAMLRRALERHEPFPVGKPIMEACMYCSHVPDAVLLPCPPLEDLRPFAEQVLQHLGDAE